MIELTLVVNVTGPPELNGIIPPVTVGPIAPVAPTGPVAPVAPNPVAP